MKINQLRKAAPNICIGLGCLLGALGLHNAVVTLTSGGPSAMSSVHAVNVELAPSARAAYKSETHKVSLSLKTKPLGEVKSVARS